VTDAGAVPGKILLGELREPAVGRGATEFVIVTGLSGAGRSTALNVLEDLGYFAIDNLPPSLISRVADLAESGRGGMPVALGVPSRGGQFTTDVDELRAELEGLRAKGLPVRTLFLEASDEVLVRRYEESRRRHPFPGERVVDSIT
jgi:RNase adapter protein RapZ